MIKKILLIAVAVMCMSTVYSKTMMSTPDSLSQEWAKSQVKLMSNDQKIGQLFMMSVWSNWSDKAINKVYSDAKNYHVGGVCFFAGTAAKQIEITNRLNAQSKYPLLIGIDGEWGAGMRVTDAQSFPYAMNVGAVSDNDLVLEMGRQIGEQCHRLGVHINFAPVHDLNSNPLNPVINYRSYGSGLDNVGQKTENYITGMQSEGVLAVAKHFPGHGDTKTDSHHALPVINKSKEEFENQEFVPFRHAIDNGLQALMMGHLNVPALDTNGLPASLSPDIIQGIVKGEMGFEGLIISDALNMHAVARGYENHYLKAFVAGIDILLFPEDLEAGFNQIKKGLTDGVITQAELDERCKRVMAYKHSLGANTFTSLSTDHLIEDLNPAKSKVLTYELLTQSMTLVRNVDAILPLQHLDQRKIAALSLNNEGESFFLTQLKSYGDVATFDLKLNRLSQVDSIMPLLQEFDDVIIGLHGSQKKRSKNYGISGASLALVNRLSAHKNVHVVVMANPYSFRKVKKQDFEKIKSLIFAYGNQETIQNLAAQGIFGGISLSGTLPLTINSFLKEGVSEKTQSCRLGYSSVPEQVGVSSKKLEEVEDIIKEVLDDEMSPGGQLLIARKGQVVYNKSFGYLTYDKKNKVDNSKLYDIASLTKIVSTTPMVMRLVDDGSIDIKAPIKDYLPELETEDKGELNLQEIMLHQAGLVNYIGFDFNLIDEENMDAKLFHKGRTSTHSIRLTPHIYLCNDYKLKEGYLSDTTSDVYDVQVAEGVYTTSAYKKEMFHMMDTMPLSDNKGYKYSDLGFYYAMRTVEAQRKQGIDTLVKNELHVSLGMNNTCYNPLRHFSKDDIAPTVNEEFFRHQLLQGYVHDQGAAFMGGVGGHAGLFSNANDIAKLMQMYLNEGSYASQHYIEPMTLRYFTQHTANDYRRGVGFDKPETHKDRPQPTCEAASPATFGHTGFTGTCAWADPENELIFIFLSNRVHPHSYNTKLFAEDIRPRIQKIIYDSLLD